MVGRIDGGAISSDGGSLLLADVKAPTRIIERIAERFVDQRNPELIEHAVLELIGQWVLDLALGYEHLNGVRRLSASVSAGSGVSVARSDAMTATHAKPRRHARPRRLDAGPRSLGAN